MPGRSLWTLNLKSFQKKNYEIATCALLPFFLSAPIVYGDVIILWEKRIQADDEDGALIISHKVPSGVIEFATSSAKCREENPVTIELDDVAEIDKITKKVKKDYYYISDKPVSVTEFVFCKRECP